MDQFSVHKPEELEEWAKAVGEKLDGQIACPVCTYLDQKMITCGDFESTLICPHCELELHLKFVDS